MRKVIAILILIGLGALLWFNPSIYNTRNQDKTEELYDDLIKEEEILQLVKADQGIMTLPVENLQSSPEEIVNFNAMIMKVMHSVNVYKNDEVVQKLTEDEIKLLVGIQRKYYHEDLLEANPESLHLRNSAKSVEQAVAEKEWIVEYKVGSAEYDPNNPDVATVLTMFMPNFSDGTEAYDIKMRYLLERETVNDQELWFIKGWVGAPEETIAE